MVSGSFSHKDLVSPFRRSPYLRPTAPESSAASHQRRHLSKVRRQFFVSEMLSIASLMGRSFPRRFLLFTMVGGLGVVVQLSVLKICLVTIGASFLASQATATFGAMTFNFLLNNKITYRDVSLRGTSLFVGLLSFYAVCAVGAIANITLASVIFAMSKIWWVAGLGGAVAGSLWNFSVSSMVTWRPTQISTEPTRVS
jgi:putative flippase GtrA